MRTFFAVLAVLIFTSTTANAQTTTTITSSFYGTVGCTFLSLTVTKIQGDANKTSLDFTIKDCGAPAIQKYSVAIPDSDFTSDKRGNSKLTTKFPEGDINISWVLSQNQHNSYNANWTWDVQGQALIKESQQQDTYSALATGTLINKIVDGRTGYFMISISRK